ncbi:MAG: TerB family tellurite resistance protein [Nostocaceae cyanobacterium]|nr:TerB family tellurite resistance protein [Nostocaceae cyanobacterium]
MVNSSHVKNLVKILIGAAWLDGKIQVEEREYLRKIAEEQGLNDDPEIKPWLYELRVVKPEQCYQWVNEYLGNKPTEEDYQQLIQAISGLIYSDGEVAMEEAKLLTKLQELSHEKESSHSGLNSLLKRIQKLYRRWIEVQN